MEPADEEATGPPRHGDRLLIPISNPFEKTEQVSKGRQSGFRNKFLSPSWACFATFTLVVVFSLLVVPTIFAMIRSQMEVQHAEEASATAWLYDTEQVCATLGVDKGELGVHSFNSSAEAEQHGARVAHCGACGQCSTKQDIDIYDTTRETLTTMVTECAMHSTRAGVEQCIDSSIGFTPSCRECWVDNIECTRQNCFYTCVKAYALGEQAVHTDADGTVHLNACLSCDERLCGPQFTLCAGANRRRTGIETDIARDANLELCDKVDETAWDPRDASTEEKKADQEQNTLGSVTVEEPAQATAGSVCVENSDCKSGKCCAGLCEGLSDGAECGLDCLCTSPDGCVEGRCGKRLLCGACAADDTCQSGACFTQSEESGAVSGFCIEPRGEGGSCSTGSHCRKRNCCMGACADRKPDGAVCGADCECVSADGCLLGACGRRPDGEQCGGDQHCHSPHGCILGTCGLRADGASCTEDAQCAAADGCVQGTCALQGGGEICGGDRDCGSGVCVRGECVEPRASGEACSDDKECASVMCCGGACTDGDGADGSACAADCACASEECILGTCGKQRIGEACTMRGECDSNLCHEGRCVAGSDNGAVCWASSECKSDNCYLGFCIEPLDNLLPCSGRAQCASGNCCGGLCTSAAADGAACAADCACESPDGCIGLTCGKNGPGGVCTANSHCRDGVCYFGFCADPGPDGTPCSDATQCQSQNCCGGLCATASPDGTLCAASCACTSPDGCIMGTCGKSGIGGLCSSDKDCKEGVCYIGVCTSGVPDGSPCTAGNVCASGTCCGALCTTPAPKGTTCLYSCACASGSCNWSYKCD